MIKVYKCCICNQTLEDKPHRLVHQEYEYKRYLHFVNHGNYDFCDNCFKRFMKWINKHNKEVEND